MNVQKFVYCLIVPTETFIFIHSLHVLLELTKINTTLTCNGVGGGGVERGFGGSNK